MTFDNKPPKIINIQQIKNGIHKFAEHFPFAFAAMAWYFSAHRPDKAITPETGTWSCIFKFIEYVSKGDTLALSAENTGCSGAACYFGFKKPHTHAGDFLAETERFKKSAELGKAFYEEIDAPSAQNKYLMLERIEDLDDKSIPEVITLWVNTTSLSGLVTLANYDRPTNNNVLIPFASGCQSVWTIPHKERFQEFPKCVVGLIDPAARVFMPSEVLSFSMPVNRLLEMADNISGSFLESDIWKNLQKKLSIEE